jgi:ABC-2 type transport system ATP-binding protein
MLEIKDLRKSFGDRVAVGGISFSIGQGESIGLLGPNGAGKTTAIAMICGILAPDSGSVLLNGAAITPAALGIKQRIGLVPQDLALYDELSAWANLELFGGLYGLDARLLAERSTRALQLVGLNERRGETVKSFSGGMKRRLNIACALLHDPDLVLLDEPTVGVDPQSRNAIFENIETLKRQGKTILYTTHYMEEAERLCDRVVIMDRGSVIANDTVAGLYAQLPVTREAVIELAADGANDQLVEELSARFGGRFRIQQQQSAKLEDVFMRLTGHALRDEADSGETS